jgi:hypothetical protein
MTLSDGTKVVTVTGFLDKDASLTLKICFAYNSVTTDRTDLVQSSFYTEFSVVSK